jgi:hypothetical protein
MVTAFVKIEAFRAAVAAEIPSKSGRVIPLLN